MNNPIGTAWLVHRYTLQVAQPLPVLSEIGGRRESRRVDGAQRERYTEAMRPEPTLRGHLGFLLKHEVPHFELLSRLFEVCDPLELQAWFLNEPTGQYARRACFLYEWFTGRRLAVEGATKGAYVDALNPERVVTASAGRSVPSRRWRVNDNMPGTPAFCPFVRQGTDLGVSMALDISALLGQLSDEFGEEVLMRSAVWMTLRESRSSFAIEGEGHQADRIQRFASVLGRRTGRGDVPLTSDSLAVLQRDILGPRTTVRAFGLRQSPVFVGESVHFQDVVHYIAPPPEDLPAMLEGLATFLHRTTGQSPVMRAAVAAFGFVYLHPLADGNGRLHRFLINDMLRRDGAVPEPLILPISSLITADPAERRAYDRILEAVSVPLMAAAAGHYTFGAPVPYPDGISSNLQVDAPERLRPVWRLPDLTPHVRYLADVIARTITQDMRQESRTLRSHLRAREAIKNIIEMPDVQADRVVRSVEQNRGELTSKLARELPELASEAVWEELVKAVRQAFDDAKPKPDAERA